MSAPVLGPSERAAWGKRLDGMLENWRDLCHKWGPGSDIAMHARDGIHALLAAEGPEAGAGVASLREFDARYLPQQAAKDALCDESEPPAAPAPDAELERLLNEVGVYAIEESEGGKHEEQRLEAARQCVREHVERREAAARGEVVGTGTLVVSAREVINVVLNHDGPALDENMPIALTRRAE